MDQYCAQKMFDELQKAGGKASMETVKLAVCGLVTQGQFYLSRSISKLRNSERPRRVFVCRSFFPADDIQSKRKYRQNIYSGVSFVFSIFRKESSDRFCFLFKKQFFVFRVTIVLTGL